MINRFGQRPETSGSDAARVASLLGALGLAPDQPIQFVTIPGIPYSKSRPRFSGKGHAFSKTEDTVAEQRTAVYLRATVRRPAVGNVALACLFYRPTRQIVDVDNLLKHLCDSANNVLWIDDSQCTGLVGSLDLDAGNPRTVIAVGTHVSGLVRDRSNPKPPKIPKGAIL